MLPQIARAGDWFVHSGIQESNGGVARFYRTDLRRNAPVSTEITGYTASALVAGRLTDRAALTARFLCLAWDSERRVMPFELDQPYAYFFDNGIIVRGLLTSWRALREPLFLDTAVAIGRHMERDFVTTTDIHPILELPSKRPIDRDPLRWSRSPGCYQLKAAMAWHDLAEATGDGSWVAAYEEALNDALISWERFLPGHPDHLKVMDRLHAFCYFLEGMLPRANHPVCREAIPEGIALVARYLGEIAPEFERSDVYAQLLRMRIFADRAGVAPLDHAAANREAARLCEFEAPGGGFYFGRRGGEWLPYLNPVSTAFAMQALAVWSGQAACIADLI